MDKKNNSLAQNAFLNVIYKLVNIAFPLVTAIYISHILQASGVGKVNYAQNIAQYFIILAPLGIGNYGVREIAKVRDSQKQVEKIFSELFWINWFSTIIFACVYYTMILSISFFEEEKVLYFVAGLPILLNLFNVEWFYQGNENYAYIVKRSIVVKLLSLILIFLFIKAPSDYNKYAFIYCFGIAGNYILNILILINRGVRLHYKGLNIKRHFKSVLVLMFTNVAIELYTLLDTTMLGIFSNDKEVGYYTNSIKLVKIVIGVICAAGGILLPRMSYYRSLNMLEECHILVKKIINLIFLFAIPSGMGIVTLAKPLVITMFGDSFIPAVKTVQIATGLIYVMGFGNLFGTQVLLTFGRERQLLISTCLGAISNISLNILLIPQFQSNGAVIASIISESLVTICLTFFVRKVINISLDLKYVIKLIISGTIMSGVIYLINSNLSCNAWSLIILILIGMLVYFGTVFLTGIHSL